MYAIRSYYVFVPAISVLIVTKIIHREKIASDLLISFKLNKWFLFAWLLMPLLAFLALGVSLLFPGVHYNPDMTGMLERFSTMLSPEQVEQAKSSLEALPVSPLWLLLIQGLIAGVTVNAVAAFGESYNFV